MNVRQLQYFLQIAELRSFTRAANVLHVAQPALSRQIRSLEEELGCTLFNRFDRGVTLTDAGVLLRDRAGEILRQLDQLRDEIAQHATEPRGEVSIGMPPSMREMLTVPLVREARRRFPHLVLHLQEGISMTLAELARSGKLDCAVVSDSEPLALVEHEPLLSEQLYLLGPPSAKLNLGRAVSLQQVSDAALILTSRPNSLRLIVENALAKSRLPLNLVVDGNSTAAMLDLVEEKVGWTVLPYCAAAERLRTGRLTGAPVRDLRVAWTLVYARERGLSLAAKQLKSLAVELAGERIAGGRWPSAKLAV